MLEALHTRDLLKHSTPAMAEGASMAAEERARLLESGSEAANRSVFNGRILISYSRILFPDQKS